MLEAGRASRFKTARDAGEHLCGNLSLQKKNVYSQGRKYR